MCFLSIADQEIIAARDAIVRDLITSEKRRSDPPRRSLRAAAAQLDRGDSESARGKEQRKVEKEAERAAFKVV